MSVCELLLSNLAEHYDAFGIDPLDLNWIDFINNEEYGLLAIMGSSTTGYPPKLSGPDEVLRNVNGNFDTAQYEAQIGQQEADFLFALYQRSGADVPDDILITCELLDKIVQTPIDQLANIDYSSFGGEENESESEGEATPSAGLGGFGGGFAAGGLGGGLGSLGGMGGGLPAATQPMPAAGGSSLVSNLLTGGLGGGGLGAMAAQAGAPMQPTTFPATTPAFPTTQQQQFPTAQPMNPAVASSGKDLPYIVVSVKGIKPSQESRVLAFKLTEADGNVIRVSLFLTAGQVPSDFVETKFDSSEFDKSDNEQKSAIHNQNRRRIMAEQMMPMRLSNGIAEDGVCAQRVQGFELVEKINQTLPDCAPDSNRPKSVRGAVFESPKSGPFGTSLAYATPAAGGTTFTGFGGQPVATGGVGLGALSTMGGIAGPATVAETEPAGTIQIQVPDFDNINGPMKIAYKIPGGPTPVAVSKDWYWFELPTGEIVKSRKKYLGLGDKEWWSTRHSAGQKELFPALRMRMGQLYGPNYKMVSGAATKTSSGPPPKSTSGRRKAGATLAPIPGFTGIGGGGFGMGTMGPIGGSQMPAVGTQPPTLQAGAQPPTFQPAAQPSMFGIQQQQPMQQQQPATSIFGTIAPAATQQPFQQQTMGGQTLFGQTQQPMQQPAPSIFGTIAPTGQAQPPFQQTMQQQTMGGQMMGQTAQPVTQGGQSLLSSLIQQTPGGQQTMGQMAQGTTAAVPNPFASVFGGPAGQPSLAPPLQSQPATKPIVPTNQPAASGLTSLFGV